MPDSADQVLAQFFNLDAADIDVIRNKVGAGLSLGDVVASIGAGGGGGGGYLERLRKKGAGGVAGKRWQVAGAINAATTTGPLAGATLYAVPLLSGPGGTLTDLGFENTTLASAGGVVRLGVYNNLPGDVWPGSPLYDSGDIATDVATGIKQKNGLSVALTADSLYWLALSSGVATCTVRAIASSGAMNFWATDLAQTSFTASLNYCINYGTAYGPMPSPFPTATPVWGTLMPLIAYTLT